MDAPGSASAVKLARIEKRPCLPAYSAIEVESKEKRGPYKRPTLRLGPVHHMGVEPERMDDLIVLWMPRSRQLRC